MYHICFIHSSVNGHLGCLHVLAVVNSAPVNIGVHVSFWNVFFSGYMPSVIWLEPLFLSEVYWFTMLCFRCVEKYFSYIYVCVCVCVCVCVYIYIYIYIKGFPGGSVVKNPPTIAGDWIRALGQRDPWRRKWQPTLVFLPGNSHGQRSLCGLQLSQYVEYCSLCSTINLCLFYIK